MPNRYTYAGFWGGARGYGFGGDSPAWPYVGRGRGGLPRCMSPSAYSGWPSRQLGWAVPRFGPQMTREQEIDMLKDEQQFIKDRLEQIDKRMQELEKGKEK